MNIETIVFDHSGTISNDFHIVWPSANNILRIFGRPQITEAQYRADYGDDIAAVYRKWGVNASIEELNRIHSRFLKSRPNRPKPIPFAVETVKSVSNLVRRVVSFSAHPAEELERDLRDWGVYGYFGRVYGGVRKHLDDDFRRMLRETGAKRQTMLYVGDTTVDICLAKRNLVRCAAVVDPRYCYQDPAKVRSNFPQADFYLNDISALVQLLKNSK